MSEIEVKKPYRIPIEEDYDSALKAVETLFDSNGGVWSYYHKSSLIKAHYDYPTHVSVVTAASQARLIEPIEDNKFTPIDPTYRATHAFRAGMWTGNFIAKHIHSEYIKHAAIHNTILQAIPYKKTRSQEEYESNGSFLLSLGDEGLQLMGFAARERLDSLGNAVIDDESFRRYYALGAGAIVHTSHTLYSQVHEALEFEYEVSKLSDEVSEYLTSIGDTSDN